jgi:hypothetical protein
MRGFAIVALFLTSAINVQAQSRAAEIVRQVTDSAAVVRFVDEFHEALAQNDSTSVYRMLSPTAAWIDEDEILTMAYMRSRGAAAKGRWERAIQRERGALHVRVSGDAAWAYRVWPMHARAQPDLIRGTEAELLVLTRTGVTWQIQAIHTSVGSR